MPSAIFLWVFPCAINSHGFHSLIAYICIFPLTHSKMAYLCYPFPNLSCYICPLVPSLGITFPWHWKLHATNHKPYFVRSHREEIWIEAKPWISKRMSTNPFKSNLLYIVDKPTNNSKRHRILTDDSLSRFWAYLNATIPNLNGSIPHLKLHYSL